MNSQNLKIPKSIHDEVSTLKKAQIINTDPEAYGAFAEIGAGQEVARHFFKAGLASQTVAKSMSAYDMKVSDAIYGRAARYVCEDRVRQMLDHEYELLISRLGNQRTQPTRFFAFANTVTTSSVKSYQHVHGWMGVRFQLTPGGPHNDIILHLHMKDRGRLEQQEALGVVGVNLIFNALYVTADLTEFIDSLTDNLGRDRIEINAIHFAGPGLKHLDARLAGLELLRRGLTKAVIFDEAGELRHAADMLYQQPCVVQRGVFRPITKANLEIINGSVAQLRQMSAVKKEARVFLEISLHHNAQEQAANHNQDFLDRADLIQRTGHAVMLTDFRYDFELKAFLRHYSDEQLVFLIGAGELEHLFDPARFKALPGGILLGLAQLFDERTQVYVHPLKLEHLCMTALSFTPAPQLVDLYRYFTRNQMIVDLLGCDDVMASVPSKQVRDWLKHQNPEWEQYVPTELVNEIKTRKLFKNECQ